MYLLPAIDILDGRAVRLKKGDYDQVTYYNDDPLDQAKIFEAAGAQWVHIVDLNGAREGKQTNLGIIEAIASQTSLKIENGGGVRDLDAVARLHNAGVARVVLGTALVNNLPFAAEAVQTYDDLLCAGVDARNGKAAVEGWHKETMSADELIAEMGALGFKHLVYTDIARDGMQTGIDPAAYTHVAKLFGSPVIASGGVTNMDDLRNLAAVADSIEGIITGRAIYEGTLALEEALAFCKSIG